MNWAEETLITHRIRIDELKLLAAQKARQSASASAKELALGLLEAKNKNELLLLAEKYKITIKKSARKNELVFALNSNQNLCEALIGLRSEI